MADYYIDILRRPMIRHWAMRYGADLKLERAVDVAMKQLAANPPQKDVRPPFPLRAPSAKK